MSPQSAEKYKGDLDLPLSKSALEAATRELARLTIIAKSSIKGAYLPPSHKKCRGSSKVESIVSAIIRAVICWIFSNTLPRRSLSLRVKLLDFRDYSNPVFHLVSCSLNVLCTGATRLWALRGSLQSSIRLT